MLKAFKYRIYPTPAQKKQIDDTLNICRYVYNVGLETKIRAWQSARINLSAYDLQKQLTEAKVYFPWLRSAASNALDASLQKLDQSFDRFFNGDGFPRFKSKRGRQSFQCKNNLRKIDFDNGLLSICRIKDIPIVISRRFSGQIRSVTISKTPTEKYFASILVKVIDAMPATAVPKRAVGVDLGLKSFLILSNGEKIDNPRYFKRSLDRLRVLGRRASKKKSRSKNQQRAFRKTALLHEKIANQRADFLHKVSSKLIHDSQVDAICIESLCVNGMVKNTRLSKSIMDAGWGQFIRMLEYKAIWYGKSIIRVDKFYPSSKTCSYCGNKIAELLLETRQWCCEKCGKAHDRDVNAAINIKNQGLIISRRGTPVEPVELPSIEGAEKQETLPKYNHPVNK